MDKITDRPYLKYSIFEMEGVFEKGRRDYRILGALAYELDFRVTDRAVGLREKVLEALISLAGKQVDLANVAGAKPSSAQPGMADVRPENPESPPSAPQDEADLALIDLGPLSSIPIPKGTNEPLAILGTWTAFEALTPQTYRRPEDMAGGDRGCVAALSTAGLPWEKGEPSRPKCQLYYQIILGAIPMDLATERLVKAFGKDEERGSRLREKAAIAAILVDKTGVLVEINGIAVSSFAWALPLALTMNLGALGAWPRIEPIIIGKLDDILRRVDQDGKPIPLDLARIERAYHWLVAQFGLPVDLVEGPSFAVRIFHPLKAKNSPEASLLNSFLLGDLARAAALVRQNEAPAGLRRYLGIDKPPHTVDLFTDRLALEKVVAPAKMPAARWPSPGGHPLVLLQQAAVNIARSDLAGGEGLVAVNGPPGTGKTTLLRDVIAAGVLDRALAMAAFDDPETAFTPTGEKVAMGERAFFNLFSLAPTLKGHEILVASSNNKAVENVSRELPAAKAVGRSFEELSYFRSISDLVHGPLEALGADEEGKPGAAESVETWGLIAAVLGNGKNRAAFQKTFWWDDDRGFRLYLKAAKGDPVVREIKDPETKRVVERRTPSVVAFEAPPSPQTAKGNWRRARERLLALKDTVDAEVKALEDARQLCQRLRETNGQLAECDAMLNQLGERRSQVEADKLNYQASVLEAQRTFEKCRREAADHHRLRPGLQARLFRKDVWTAWSQIQAPLDRAEAQAEQGLKAAEQALNEATRALAALASELWKAEDRLVTARRESAKLSQEVDALRGTLGDRLVDEQFFSKDHDALNLAVPWVSDGLHRKREDLFIAALAAHRAFIDASAQKVLHNLSVLMSVFSSGPPQDDARRQLLGDLWSTLFMVVPVLSTTFASVERMLGSLPVGSIGWLLVDEAGQAVPQAAVGAALRAKRLIVVGDPLQIPPVVTLPERLISEICTFFKVDRPVWAAPEASVQTLADRASRFQAAFRSDEGPRRVGIPLLVHRRCQEPMFGIANKIAYDGQMVHAPGKVDPGDVGRVLGPSAWFDIDGEAESKWCPAEGDFVVSLLTKIASAGITNPDLFIVTPFRVVAQELRRRLEREKALFAALKIDIDDWASDRIGTIHTVQGREADTVIFVLGAPQASQNGARAWASGTPNILNVAVSRAKQTLYVVGSYGSWSGVGHARELASLPRQRDFPAGEEAGAIRPDRTMAL
ncbi:helicase [Rhodospirillum rubrum]|uniref:DEAD/DEAH box helicase n=1 Tax=Rhodospirillum rubrum TaxID=1085 RepID=UPI0019036134|nr:DEAD/DEAH box helicase [Rhodospirillum rubrum]MBK1664315.1 helicase [Rhodospirillum rubrum]MBK1677391.1 helicase [Rhodospirillum rubrum]